MRKNIVAGNWKMNTNLHDGLELAKGINEEVAKGINDPNTGVVIATPFTHLVAVNEVIDTDKICLAAQNCATEESGAYTGEISGKMLKSVGVKAVILGHSERRSYYGENNETLLKKVNLVLANEMKPIFCIGEVDTCWSTKQSSKSLSSLVSDMTLNGFNRALVCCKHILIGYFEFRIVLF